MLPTPLPDMIRVVFPLQFNRRIKRETECWCYSKLNKHSSIASGHGMCLENLRDKRREKLENDGAVFFLKWRSFDRGSNENNRDIILGVPRIKKCITSQYAVFTKLWGWYFLVSVEFLSQELRETRQTERGKPRGGINFAVFTHFLTQKFTPLSMFFWGPSS